MITVTKNTTMKKLILIFCCILTASCVGPGCFLFGDCDDTETYTYIITNNSGTKAIISVGDMQKEVSDDGTFECSYSETSNFGLCQGFLEIRFLSNGKGYRCEVGIPIEELCFIEDWRAFSTSQEGGIFEEISPRIYEYVLTPDLLENAFELPEE